MVGYGWAWLMRDGRVRIMTDIEYRKVQGLLGDQSFSIVLPKSYAIQLGIGKGDSVKVSQEGDRIIIEKA
jgi:AbrB family looped-hinge helix DNA binding protein